jgi:SNF2 family DNA or RNA helicase
MELFKHQIEAIERGKVANVALFHDCGTGKTATALNIIAHHKVNGFTPALVVCPLSIIDAAWLEDCRKFTPELSIVSLWSKKPTERLKRLNEQHDIYVINFDAFKGLYKEIAAKRFGVLIVDESSKMKCPKTQITRALLSFAGIPFRGSPYKTNYTIPYRYVLSGTPAPNSEAEYWPQIKMITGPGGRCFNDNFYAFRNTFFLSIPLGLTGQKLFKFRDVMREEFMARMKTVTHIVRKADALDLLPQVHEIRKVYLSPDEATAYETFKRDLVLHFEDTTILAANALTEVMKLRQLSSGFAYTDTGVRQTGTSKLKELKELLEEIGDKQVIIWCNFRHEISELQKELPSSDALWAGTPDRDKTINGFKAGQFQYLICNPMSAAHGLTFTNCSYAVYFSLNYSYEMQKQSQDRIHRIGQTDKCTYYYLIAAKTVDEIIYKAVGKKENLSNTILNYLRTNSHAEQGCETVRA